MGIRTKMRKLANKIDNKLDYINAKLDKSITEDELMKLMMADSVKRFDRNQLLEQLVMYNVSSLVAAEMYAQNNDDLFETMYNESKTGIEYLVSSHPELMMHQQLIDAMSDRVSKPVNASKEALMDYMKRADACMKAWARKYVSKDEYKAMKYSAYMHMQNEYIKAHATVQ